MPKYEVIEKGFYQGKLYDPNGKRRNLFTEKAFKKAPSWLKAVKAESAAEKKKREAAEKDALAADQKKADEDKKAIEDMNFMGEGEKSQSSVVETL